MKIIRNISQMQSFSCRVRQKGKKIGFVPTMGYLHLGHLSLVHAACRECDIVVVSVFVNPAQFGPREDFSRYPRDFSRDKKLLTELGVDVIFCPRVRNIYSEGYKTYVEVEKLSEKLCGVSRPGHFRGVTTIVLKLFNIVQPDIAYFGRKDFQQQVIIKKMVKDLNLPLKIVALPTVRETDGLAMSSRNLYLSPPEREAALILSYSLEEAQKMVKKGIRDTAMIAKRIRGLIREEKLVKLDYLMICDPQEFTPVKKIKGKTLIALAAFVGKTRLIDNIVV